MRPLRYLLPPFCAVLCLAAAPSTAARGPPSAVLGPGNGQPTLSATQKRAVGIVIAPAPAAKMPRRIDAYGRVLDPSRLVADAGRLDSAQAIAAAAAAETARLKGLYRGANASLKALQVAEAEQTEMQARAREARSEFLLRWGPVARLGDERRARLIGRLAGGRQLLLRADLPGDHSLGLLPQQALVDVDGVKVPARVLGPLTQSGPIQSVGLLLQITHPPAGLGPGARLPVMLEGVDKRGRLVPDGALLYGKQGVYVYRVLPGETKGRTRFAPVRVIPLQPVGGGWLVSGLHADDRIVVRGAGVLWSLQGLGRISGGDD